MAIVIDILHLKLVYHIRKIADRYCNNLIMPESLHGSAVEHGMDFKLNLRFIENWISVYKL